MRVSYVSVPLKVFGPHIEFHDYIREIDPYDYNYCTDQETEGATDEIDLGGIDSVAYESPDWSPAAPKRVKRERRENIDQQPDRTVMLLDEKESSINKFTKDLHQASRQQLGKRILRLGCTTKGQGKRLNPALQGLMGEANLRFARGDTDTAIRMCMEVVRQEPNAPEPYQTLSTLYENFENDERALQFALIAAHLAPHDSEEWASLADRSLEQGNPKQAVDCFQKAVNADPKCLRYHWSRCAGIRRLVAKGAPIQGP